MNIAFYPTLAFFTLLPSNLAFFTLLLSNQPRYLALPFSLAFFVYLGMLLPGNLSLLPVEVSFLPARRDIPPVSFYVGKFHPCRWDISVNRDGMKTFRQTATGQISKKISKKSENCMGLYRQPGYPCKAIYSVHKKYQNFVNMKPSLLLKDVLGNLPNDFTRKLIPAGIDFRQRAATFSIVYCLRYCIHLT